MSKVRWLLITVSIVLIAAFALTACKPAASSEAPAEEAPAEAVPAAEEPKVGGTIVYATTEEPDTLDEQKSGFAITDAIVSQIGSSLVWKDKDGNYIPYMAESWEATEDGLTWTFHLKKTPKFHNGDPVTAKDWVYTINRVKDPNFISPLSAGLFEPITKAEAADDYTLVLSLDEPFYPILENLTSSGYGGVWSQRAIEEAGDQYGWTVAIGAGPYKFVEWVQDEKIVLERNPDFTWGPIMWEGCNPGPYYIERQEWRIVPDSATVLASLEAGELNYAAVSPKDMATIEATGRYDTVSGLNPGIWYLEFNLSKPPFDNEHVRRAFNYMIDRDEIINVVRQGKAVKVLGAMSPAMIGYWPGVEEVGLDYNPDKAKEEFLAAGYTYAEDGTVLTPEGQPLVLDLWTIAGDEGFVKWSTVMSDQFAKQGVKINIQQLEWTALAAKLSEGSYEMDTMGVTWPEADILYMMFHSNAAWWNQMAKNPNAELDALLKSTRTNTDPVLRQEAVNKALTYITEKAYVAPVLAVNLFIAVDKNIKGWNYSPYYGINFQSAYFSNLP